VNREDIFDKRQWGKGEWQREPDYQSWIDKETRYACVARRNVFGAWLGQVGVDTGHPLYMLSSASPEFEFIETHGKPADVLTCFNKDDAMKFIPPQKLWWIGFSCMGDGDFCPWIDQPRLKGKKLPSKVYRNLAYVVEQIEFLASQLASFDARIF
jgi:hypothetical protein